MKIRLALNAASGSVVLVVNVVVAFVLSPILVRTLGDAGYGIWVILISVLGYMSILDLGVSPAIVRYVARAAGAGDDRAVREIVSSALALLAITGAVACGVMVLLGRVPGLVGIPATGSELPAVFAVLAVNLLLVFPGMTFSAYQFGLQRHHLANAIKVVQTAGQGVAWYLVLTRTDGPYLPRLAMVLTAGNLLYFGSLAVVSLTGRDRIRPARSLIRGRRVAELYHYGAGSMVLMLADRLQKQVVPILIGLVIGAGQVVFYSLPHRLITYATGLAAAVTLPMTPYFSHLEGSEPDLSRTRMAWTVLSRSLQFVIVGMGIAVTALGEPFIARWIGPVYAEEGRWVIRILGASLFVEAAAPVASQLLMGRGLHRPQARRTLVLALAGLPLLALLGKLAGVAGIAAGYLAIRVAVIAVWTDLACRALELSVPRHLTGTLGRYAVPAVVGLGVLWGLRVWSHPDGYPAILGHGGLGAAAYVATALALAVNGTERRAAMAAVWRLLRRRGGSEKPG